MAHQREELGFRLTRRLGLGTRQALPRELRCAFLCSLSVGDVAEGDDQGRLTFPFRVDDPELDGDRPTGRAHQLYFGALSGDQREPKICTDQRLLCTAEQLLGRLVDEA